MERLGAGDLLQALVLAERLHQRVVGIDDAIDVHWALTRDAPGVVVEALEFEVVVPGGFHGPRSLTLFVQGCKWEGRQLLEVENDRRLPPVLCLSNLHVVKRRRLHLGEKHVTVRIERVTAHGGA